MVKVVISIGSNCGDRVAQVKEALSWLSHILIETHCSGIYETPCAKNTGKPYLNAVIEGIYQESGIDLKDQIEEILKEKELKMGRNAQCREKGEVPIDMDLVLMDGEIIKPWDYRQKFFQIGYSQIKGN